MEPGAWSLDAGQPARREAVVSGSQDFQLPVSWQRWRIWRTNVGRGIKGQCHCRGLSA